MSRRVILVFEMTWTGSIHAPGNSATIQIVARAWPEQTVRIHAEAEHLGELQRDSALTALPNVEFVEIAVSELYRGRTNLVSWQRMAQEFRTVRAALRKVPKTEPCLVFLIATTATGSFAAAWASYLSGRRTGVQVGFHGNLNDARAWRSRNPLIRGFDTRAAVEARHPVPLRFLVLETAIRDAMQDFAPVAAARTDVVQLPINTAELAGVTGSELEEPVRIGFVGLGTKAKGFDLFLEVAQRAKARWGARVVFVHVGCVPADWQGQDDGLLTQPISRDGLSRTAFLERLAGLHYVILPYRLGYYDLSASGALIDALTWLKPVIATRVPLTAQFFRDYGDIGLLCDTEEALGAAVDTLLENLDAEAYARQVAALRAARETRRVEALAAHYRSIITQGFPGLLPTSA
jgi:glycosyltransferase involved in cell wall biosynthesis